MPTLFDHAPKLLRSLILFGPICVLILTTVPIPGFAADSKKGGPQAGTCKNIDSDSGFDESTDIGAVKAYEDWIAQLLKEEKFDDLDCIADSVRSSKVRFSGGAWKIHRVYSGLTEPQPGMHATAEDWKDHVDRLERWVAAKPRSITARVALAKSYAGYAWDARGSDYADTVSESGWQLFRLRLAKAKSILDEASALKAKCPEWYVAMQQVALGQGWETDQAAELLQRATSFEPGYYYYYRMQANYLLPRWNGSKGDSPRFAQESADRLGGQQGDELYFFIGGQIVCSCNEPEFNGLSWPRLQKGFEAVEKEFGPSMANVNLLALMAVKAGQVVPAAAAFKRIGTNWDKDTWRTEEYFTRSKNWADRLAPIESRTRSIMQEASANLQTPEGAQYKKEVEQSFVSLLQQCSPIAKSDQGHFMVMIKVAEDGGPEDTWMPHQSALMTCLMQQLMKSRKQAPFPPPPHPSYWVQVMLDVTAPDVASK